MTKIEKPTSTEENGVRVHIESDAEDYGTLCTDYFFIIGAMTKVIKAKFGTKATAVFVNILQSLPLICASTTDCITFNGEVINSDTQDAQDIPISTYTEKGDN